MAYQPSLLGSIRPIVIQMSMFRYSQIYLVQSILLTIPTAIVGSLPRYAWPIMHLFRIIVLIATTLPVVRAAGESDSKLPALPQCAVCVSFCLSLVVWSPSDDIVACVQATSAR